jgi:oxepin-CoA hydrolase/3-oxo-5,6-dehydrosuberyl-CoA semialdehyde dehydrogenase
MTGKAGQKCTAIRRIIVPEQHVDAVGERLRERLAKIVVGNPSVEGVRMGALASMDQQRDVASASRCSRAATRCCSAPATASSRWARACGGAFFSPTLLLCRNGMTQRRRARHRSLRPGQHHDDLPRHRRSAGTWPRAARAAW